MEITENIIQNFISYRNYSIINKNNKFIIFIDCQKRYNILMTSDFKKFNSLQLNLYEIKNINTIIIISKIKGMFDTTSLHHYLKLNNFDYNKLEIFHYNMINLDFIYLKNKVIYKILSKTDLYTLLGSDKYKFNTISVDDNLIKLYGFDIGTYIKCTYINSILSDSIRLVSH